MKTTSEQRWEAWSSFGEFLRLHLPQQHVAQARESITQLINNEIRESTDDAAVIIGLCKTCDRYKQEIQGLYGMLGKLVEAYNRCDFNAMQCQLVSLERFRQEQLAPPPTEEEIQTELDERIHQAMTHI